MSKIFYAGLSLSQVQTPCMLPCDGLSDLRLRVVSRAALSCDEVVLDEAGTKARVCCPRGKSRRCIV